MKKPIIIVFIIILSIHLIALGLFLIFQKDDNSKKDTEKKELIKEPEIDPPPINQEDTHKGIKHSTANKLSGFYVEKKFPSFEFKDAAKGNLSAIPLTKGAKAGILVDLDTGKVLWAKNAKEPVPIASMTKMMTVLIVFEAIRMGQIDYNQNIKVSKSASSIGGSDIWLDPRETFPLKDLLKAVLIKSANDAAQLLGETLGNGNIDVFVNKMNTRASELGLKKAKFYNPHGLPGPKDNVATCEELAKLAALLLQYPDVIKMSSTKIDYINRKIGPHKRTELSTTNYLVKKGVEGVDGLKTGFTQNAGFCLTATCKRNGKRLIAVVTGFRKPSERNECVKQLLEWGYKNSKSVPQK